MADIPAVHLSKDYSRPPEFHFGQVKQLANLREHGLLMIGGGNIIHKLRLLQLNNQIPDWSSE